MKRWTEGLLANPFVVWQRIKRYKCDMPSSSEAWYMQALSPTAMQAVLGTVSFKATENPPVTEPTTKPDKVLEGILLIPVDTWYKDGTGTHTK